MEQDFPWMKPSAGAKFEHNVAFAPVSALSFSQDSSSLFVGYGPSVQVYDVVSGSLIQTLCIFPGGRVHGIRLVSNDLSPGKKNRVIVFGQKNLAMLQCDESTKTLTIEYKFSVQDWIWDCAVLPEQLRPTKDSSDECICVGTAHNVVEIWNTSSRKRIQQFKCSEKCMLYSLAFLHFRQDNDQDDANHRLFVASGTVFNQVVIWEPLVSVVPLARLIGHDGVIWNVRWSPDGSQICSVSDDRSARVWSVGRIFQQQPKINTENTADGTLTDLPCSLELFGHSARVWDALFASTASQSTENINVIVTASEDKTCAIWDASTGERLASMEGHKGGIWKIACDSKFRVLASGAGDCSVRLWDTATLRAARIETQNDLQLLNQWTIPTSSTSSSKKSDNDFVRTVAFNHQPGRQHDVFLTTNKGLLYRIRSLCGAKNEVIPSDDCRILAQFDPGVVVESLLVAQDHSSSGSDLVFCADLRGGIRLFYAQKYEQKAEILKWTIGLRKAAALFLAPISVGLIAALQAQFSATLVQSIFVALLDGPLQWWVILEDSGQQEGQRKLSAKLLGVYFPPTTSPVNSDDSSESMSMEEPSSDSEQDASSSSDEEEHPPKKSKKAVFKTQKKQPPKHKGIAQQARFPTIWSVLVRSAEHALVCGDSNGNIHLFAWPPTDIREQHSGDQAQSPIHTLRHVHSRERVATLANSVIMPDAVLSGGRDGHYSILRLYKSPQLRLAVVSTSKVHRNMEFVEKIVAISKASDEENVLAFGFYGTRAILFDISQQRVLFSINCGGFKRPFDISLSSMDNNAFVFQKDATVYGYTPRPAPSSPFLKQTVHDPYHWRETNCIKFVKPKSKQAHLLPFVTTSEDTTIFIGQMNLNSHAATILQKMSSHDSATRCADFAFCGSGEALLVIGGGRLQLRIFKESAPGSNSFSHVASADPPPRRSGNKKKKKDDYNECRIMSVAVVKLDHSSFMIAAARSDAVVDVWIFRDINGNSSVTFIAALRHQHAVLSLASAMVRDSWLLISACTDGSLHFWDFNSYLYSELKMQSSTSSSLSLSAPSFVTLHANSPHVDPILITRPHQAGINSLDIDFNTDESLLTVVTSGDDQDLCVQHFTVEVSEVRVIKVIELPEKNIRQENVANSCVSGARLIGSNHIVTVSGDQRLTVWDKSNLGQVASTMLHIADVSDVDVIEHAGKLVAVAVGQGLEAVKIEFLS